MTSLHQQDFDGATAVITHRVRAGQEANYEQWLKEIVPLCRTFPGHLDWQVIRPITGLTSTFTVIIRFNTHDHLLRWLHSSDRQRLIEKASPFLAAEDKFFTQSGLDFLFAENSSKANAPRRWKQFLVTLAAIYPLSLLSHFIFTPVLLRLGLPNNLYLINFFISVIAVYLMVYVVMPQLTSLIKKWLYK